MPQNKLTLCKVSTQEQIRAAWESFIQGKPFDTRTIRPIVMKGWQVSRKQGFDPLQPYTPTQLPINKLLSLEQYQRLHEGAAPMMRTLQKSLRNTGNIALLTLAPGYLVDFVGDKSILNEQDYAHISPGYLYSLETAGGLSVALCQKEKKPVLLAGYEHYNKWHQHRHCASAPIFDATGDLLGALCLIGLMVKKDINNLTMATVCANNISAHLKEISLCHTQQQLNTLLQSVLDSLPGSVMAISRDGVVTHANRTARQRKGEDLPGKNITSFFKASDATRITDILRSNRDKKVLVSDLYSPQDGLAKKLCQLTPVNESLDTSGGMILTVTLKNQLSDMAKHVEGNYAQYSFSDLKGKNEGFLLQVKLAKKVAPTSSRVLLTGESGTGKELFAQAIHNSSQVSDGPFVAISCAAIPRDLIEAELFGYVGGAFTGANRNGMIGKFELASGGTLFLDEINSLPLEMQGKLLRILQQNEVVRIGDSKPRHINVRLIAASNACLLDAVHQGVFREDLYYRLNVIEIIIPALQERKDDIALLANSIVKRQSTHMGRKPPSLAPKTLEAMLAYPWPGNVRELDNACERALLFTEGNTIHPEHLPVNILHYKPPVSRQQKYSSQLNTYSIDLAYKEIITYNLSLYNGNISLAAKALGISRSTLYRKMRSFGLR